MVRSGRPFQRVSCSAATSVVCAAVCLALGGGCRHVRGIAQRSSPSTFVPAAVETEREATLAVVESEVRTNVRADAEAPDGSGPEIVSVSSESPEPASAAANDLLAWEMRAIEQNAQLSRMRREVNAAWAKVRYQDQLPDPTIGANVFGRPMNGERANLNVMQMIPWLKRLDAQAQQACFEAMVMQQMFEAERLRIVRELREAYFRLYVVQKQMNTIRADQELLNGLIEVINARLTNSRATQGDVLLGTLEYSRLEEQLVTLRQQLRSTQAEINRLMNRPADTPVAVPDEIAVSRPDWTHEMLRTLCWDQQPEIIAAQLRTNASHWGLEVAELQRRPDVSVGAMWAFMGQDRSMMMDGEDAWSLGATISIPLWHEKYDAMRDEATWNHFASQSQLEEVRRQYDAELLNLLEQARAAEETARLYGEVIIPQARQTLAADQDSLANGTVEFDRVIQDFRSLLTLEFNYHRALGDLAIATARIQQAVGVDLRGSLPVSAEPPGTEDAQN